MFDAIREINAAGTAVLLVEQNVAMAIELAKHAYLIEEGRIVADGAPDDAVRAAGAARAYLGLLALCEEARGP
jgi:branched-chain amino acid transport system ATP-binding protein